MLATQRIMRSLGTIVLLSLTYLLFLKMAKETGTEDQIPKGYRWDDRCACSTRRSRLAQIGEGTIFRAADRHGRVTTLGARRTTGWSGTRRMIAANAAGRAHDQLRARSSSSCGAAWGPGRSSIAVEPREPQRPAG